MDEMKMDLEQIKEPGENFDYMFLSEDEYNDLVLRIQEEIDKLKLENTEEGPGDIMQLNIFLHGLRDLMSKARILDERYSDMVTNGSYYTYYFKNPKETKEGEICLILDGKPTDHIIPHETLEELNEDIEQYIYDGNGEKYTPLASIVGNRPFLPVAWYIKICVGVEPEKPKSMTIKAPQDLFMTLDKVTQSINNKKIDYNIEDFTGVGTGKGGSSDYVSGVMLSFDETLMQEFSSNRELTSYDMAVFMAVCSSIVAGGEFIPIGTINNALAGKKTKLHDTQKNEIMESIRKLMGTIIKIDVSGEPKTYAFDKLKVEGAMLMGYLTEYTVKGNTVSGFLVQGTPPLLWYAQSKKQFASVSTNLFNVPINNTRASIALKNTLMNIILRIKRSPNMNNAINYDNLIDTINDSEITTERADRRRRSDTLAKTAATLEYWKQQGFIDGYEEHTTGRKKDYVKIFCKPANKAPAKQKK